MQESRQVVDAAKQTATTIVVIMMKVAFMTIIDYEENNDNFIHTYGAMLLAHFYSNRWFLQHYFVQFFIIIMFHHATFTQPHSTIALRR